MFGMQTRPAAAGGGFGFGSAPATTASTTTNAPGAATTTTAAANPFGSIGFGSNNNNNTTTAPLGFGAWGSSGSGTATAVNAATATAASATAAAPQATTTATTSALPWQDFTRQSALASYVHELDKAYNALHPQCRFRAFVYNACGAGQAAQAVQRERYVAYCHGGGCDVAEYAHAQHVNPDKAHLYPSPLHFTCELQTRVTAQRAAVQQLRERVEQLHDDAAAVAALQRSNARTHRALRDGAHTLQQRWHALLRRTEVLRRFGVASEAEALLLQRVQSLRQSLTTPGQVCAALCDAQALLTHEQRAMSTTTTTRAAAASARGDDRNSSMQRTRSSVAVAAATSAGGSSYKNNDGVADAAAAATTADGQRPLLLQQPPVDAAVLRDWLQVLRSMQRGIDALYALVERDVRDMRAIRERVVGDGGVTTAA